MTSDLFDAAPTAEYKSDTRSRVWRVGTPPDAQVIKAFRVTGLGATLKGWVGRHPAQVEQARNAEMRAAGLPVVPITAAPTRGGVRHLVTPWQGESFQRHQRAGSWPDDARRRFAVEALGKATNEMFTAGFVNRDLKTANVLADPNDPHRVWFIDVGGARRSTDTDARRRTVGMLIRTLTGDGFPEPEIRKLQAVIEVEPGVAMIEHPTGRM